jgi:hypothetical protein
MMLRGVIEESIRQPFVRVVHLGRGPRGSVFCKVSFDAAGNLSITGVEGPKRNGDCMGSCGQIVMSPCTVTDYAPGWDAEKVGKLWQVWDRWSGNDKRPGCEHQRAEGLDASRKLLLRRFKWSDEFYQRRRAAEEGRLPADEYPAFARDAKLVHSLLIAYPRPRWFSGAVLDALRDGLIVEDGVEERAAGSTFVEEHPDGMLCRPCPVCGYKYGTAWLREEVPFPVLVWLRSRPEADITPAWV